MTGFARDELYKIDPRTNTLVQTIALRSSPRFLTAGEGSIWILNQGDGTVQRIDPMSGEVIASIEQGTQEGVEISPPAGLYLGDAEGCSARPNRPESQCRRRPLQREQDGEMQFGSAADRFGYPGIRFVGSRRRIDR